MKAKDIAGFLVEKRAWYDKTDVEVKTYNNGFNKCLDEQGEVELEISWDREKLLEVINKTNLGTFDHICRPKSKDFGDGMVEGARILNEMYKNFIVPKLADAIIASSGIVGIKVKG